MYQKFIKNTQSEKLVRGLLGLAVLWGASFVFSWAHLDLLAMFLHWLALFLSISIIVVFQPELRKFMALMGNVQGWRRLLKRDNVRAQNLKGLDGIVSAVEYMAQKNTGALIVFSSVLDESVIERKGVRIDARISMELLLTIFFDKTPLHDGAVIVENGRIAYAGAILPLSQNTLNWKYGTRHRAALGMSEVSDAACLVVSEETGIVSIAHEGHIYRNFTRATMKKKLEEYLLQDKSSQKKHGAKIKMTQKRR